MTSLSKRESVFDFLNIVWKTTLVSKNFLFFLFFFLLKKINFFPFPFHPQDPAFQEAQANVIHAAPPSPFTAAHRGQTKYFSTEGLFEDEQHTDDADSPAFAQIRKINSAETLPLPDGSTTDGIRRRSLGVEIPAAGRANAIKGTVPEDLPDIVVHDENDDTQPQTDLQRKFTKPEKIYRKRLTLEVAGYVAFCVFINSSSSFCGCCCCCCCCTDSRSQQAQALHLRRLQRAQFTGFHQGERTCPQLTARK